MTLTEFLLSRINDDETRTKEECAAKRQLVSECTPGWLLQDCDEVAASLGTTVLSYLALPYAGHPDYRDEWRP